jgi:hypothetical protein
MAFYNCANVLVFDVSGPTPPYTQIVAIKVIAGTGSPSVSIQGNNSASGPVLWEDPATSTHLEQIWIDDPLGTYINVAGTGTKVYLYIK